MGRRSYSNFVCAIVQARIGSTRLPGKIFKELEGKPILWHVINRLSHSKKIKNIIVATTDLPEDDATEEFCENNKIDCFRGSSEDVLSRYYQAAIDYEVDTIVRVTSDCPVIDPAVIDKMISKYFLLNKNGMVDYLSNTIKRTFPRGLDAEIFSFTALAEAFRCANEKYEREHVTPYIYQHPDIFKIVNYENNQDYSFHRWTVDTAEDYELIKQIYKNLYKPNKLFYFEDILKLFEEKPELIKINQKVKQKSLGE
ncbi:cytidylyltransferase domain-containing protein [Melioribacter sp. OK-6-Me]|uniref:cytidylyltransferase domain-containing protein n=1 Tax=unclassified Melioribacter TaxID=2627329 RepID=UPI003EDA862A